MLVERLRANPGFYQLYHADAATGRFVGAYRPEDETVILRRSQPDVDGGAFTEWRVDPNGSHVPHRSDVPAGYDARRRPWYALAVAQPNDELVWTEPYGFSENVPGITAAMAWRPPGEAKARGVFAIDFSLGGIADFMAEGARLSDTRGFLVTRGGKLSRARRLVPAIPTMRSGALHDALPQPLETLSFDTPVNVAVTYAGVTLPRRCTGRSHHRRPRMGGRQRRARGTIPCRVDREYPDGSRRRAGGAVGGDRRGLARVRPRRPAAAADRRRPRAGRPVQPLARAGAHLTRPGDHGRQRCCRSHEDEPALLRNTTCPSTWCAM